MTNILLNLNKMHMFPAVLYLFQREDKQELSYVHIICSDTKVHGTVFT